MPTIKINENAGATTAKTLIGESGLYSLDNTNAGYAYSAAKSGNTLTVFEYLDSNLTGSRQLDFTSINSGTDRKFTEIRTYDAQGNLTETWSSTNFLQSDLISTGYIGLFEGEDTIESNSFANYLQGALQQIKLFQAIAREPCFAYAR